MFMKELLNQTGHILDNYFHRTGCQTMGVPCYVASSQNTKT